MKTACIICLSIALTASLLYNACHDDSYKALQKYKAMQASQQLLETKFKAEYCVKWQDEQDRIKNLENALDAWQGKTCELEISRLKQKPK